MAVELSPKMIQCIRLICMVCLWMYRKAAQYCEYWAVFCYTVAGFFCGFTIQYSLMPAVAFVLFSPVPQLCICTNTMVFSLFQERKPLLSGVSFPSYLLSNCTASLPYALQWQVRLLFSLFSHQSHLCFCSFFHSSLPLTL